MTLESGNTHVVHVTQSHNDSIIYISESLIVSIIYISESLIVSRELVIQGHPNLIWSGLATTIFWSSQLHACCVHDT